MTPTGKREEEATKKRSFAIPEIVLNDYLRAAPLSGYSNYLRSACPTIDKLVLAFDRALAANTGKHGDTTEWQKVHNIDMFKNKFIRHHLAARPKSSSTIAEADLNKEHRNSAVANAVFLAFFDLTGVIDPQR